MLKQLTIVSFALAAIAAAPAAQAQDSFRSVKVPTTGIDMNSDGGAQLILRRVKNAAVQACGGQTHTTLDQQQKFNLCVQETVQRTVNGLNNARMTALLNKSSAPSSDAQVASAH